MPDPRPPAEPGLEPLVSVVVISYNHEKFIGQALQSVLDQQADWPMEVIVADDASTDSTPEIIREFADKYPGRITPILRPSNTGARANFIDALNRTRGMYLAFCEGDDYWTDPAKLRRQVSLMEQNPDVTLCFHPVRRIWDDGSSRPESIDAVERDLSLEKLLAANTMQTNSVVYRRLPSYDDIPDVMPLDWLLHIRHARQGRMAVLPQVMAVYRRHAGGVWWDYAHNPERFWLTWGERHVAFFETLINDFRDAPEFHEHIARSSADALKQLLLHGLSDADPPVLLRLLTSHPTWGKLALDQLSNELIALQTARSSLDAKIVRSRRRLDGERKKVRRIRARAERAERRIDEMLQSRTWRIGRVFVAPTTMARRKSK